MDAQSSDVWLLKLVFVLVLVLTIGVGNVWGTHTKVKAGDLVSGNKYIITATYSNNTYYLVPGDITTSTNRGSYTSSLTETAAWTFTAVSGGWTITTMVGDDLYYLYNSSSSANSVASYSDDDDPLVYTIEETSSGASTVYINGNTRYLALYTGGSNWRAYSNTSQANSQATIQLYSAGASTYTVTYDGNGNTRGTVPTDATAYSSGATVTVKGNTGSLVKTGYAFGGWNTQADGNGTNYTAGSGTFTITANTTLYAKWIPTYTVTYNGNGNNSGSVPVDGSSPYNSGTTVTVLGNTGSLAKTGWTFAGWNTNATGTGTDRAASSTFSISANTTLYAKWTCTVTWSVDGHTDVYPASAVTYNASGSKVGSIPTPNPDPEDYCGDKFVGWTDDEDYVHGTSNLFTTAGDSPNLNSTGSVTFYAVFADYDD